MLRSLATALLTLTLALAAQAAPITLKFEADDFQNAGEQYPGFGGLIQGSLSWDGTNTQDPLPALTAIDLVIAGHRYTLGEVGIANQGTTQTAIGGLVRGANAVVGDGAFDDFLIVFDRVIPRIEAFAFSLPGKTGAIWWTPQVTRAWYDDVVNPASLPGSLALASLGLATLALRRRHPRAHAHLADR